MAIPFLNNINLDDNQLQNAKLHVTSSAPTAAAGQIYFDSTVGTETAKYHNGTEWVSLIQYTPTNSTFINLAESGTDATRSLTASLSATGTPDATKYLRGDNTWSPISGIYDWTVAANTGSETVISGMTVTFKGNTYIDTTYYSSTDTVEFNHSLTTLTPTTSTASPAHGGTFTVIDTVTTNSTGHVTGINTKTVTLPSDNDTTYDLSSYGTTNGTAGIQLVGSDATIDQVDINGAGTTTVTNAGGILTITSNDQYTGTVTSIGTPADGGLTGGTITTSGDLRLKNYAALSDSTVMGWDNTNNQLENAPITYSGNDATVTGDLTVSGGDIILSGTGRIQGIDTITNGTDAVNKNYVDQAVTGALSYQGGYNAATNTPDLDSSPSSSIKTGWTYTVTADGLFFTEQVRVGDVLIAEVDAPTALSDWTTVQSNIDLATSSIVGIGNVIPGSSNTITAPYSSGTATLDVVDSTASQKGAVIVAASTGISVSYSSGTATVTNTDTNSANTATGTITAGNTSGTVTHSFGINTIVQTIDSSGNTVYCDIARTTTSVTASIAAAQAGNITILVQKIG